jgi:hypothetical protein
LSDSNEWKLRCDSSEIRGIAGYDGLAGSSCANDDVGIGDIGCSGLSQQEADCCRLPPIERNEVGAGLPDQPA